MIGGITSYNFYNTYFKNVMNSYDGKNQVPNLFSMAVAAIYSDKINTDLSKEVTGFFTNVHKNLENLNQEIEDYMNQAEEDTFLGFGQEKTDESVNITGFNNTQSTYGYNVLGDPSAQTNKSSVFKGTDLFTEENFGNSFTISKGNEEYNFQIENQGQDSTIGDVFHIIAENIRNSDAGLSAEVIRSDEGTYLDVTSMDTGTDNAFEITGDLAVSMGFNEVFNESSNFQIEINGDYYESQDYFVETKDEAVIDFTNYEDEEGTISTVIDESVLYDKMSDFSDSINNTLDFLENSSNRNLNILGKQIERDLTRYEEDLRNVGITIAGDRLDFRKADLDIDSEDIKKVFSNNNSIAKSINDRINIFENRTLFNTSNLNDMFLTIDNSTDLMYTQGYNVFNQPGAILDLRI